MTGSRAVALLAALFLTVDPLAVDFSRQAVHEIYMTFFPLAGICCAGRFMETRRAGWLVAAGVVFGLGLASKWSVAFPMAVTAGFVANYELRGCEGGRSFRLQRLFRVGSFLVLLPVLCYLLSFIPWFSRGYGIGEWLTLQQSMYRETKLHVGYGSLAERDHRAYQWFIRPVSWEDGMINRVDEAHELSVEDAAADKKETVLKAVTNPFVWLLVIPGFIIVVRKWRSGRSGGLLNLFLLFLASYLPMLITQSRPIFLNAALSVIPFAMILAAFPVVAVASRFRRFGTMMTLYAALVTVTTLPLYGAAIGREGDLPFAGSFFLRVLGK